MKHIKLFEKLVNEAADFSPLLAGITKNYSKIKAELDDFSKSEINAKNCDTDDEGNNYLYGADGDVKIYYMSNSEIKKNNFGESDNEFIINDGSNSVAIVYI
jgi:hypothetical protein